MNVKRFTARTSREAFALVRQEYGEDAVVLSTKPCAEGVEVLAMAPDSVAQLERVSAQASAESAHVDPRDTTGGRLAAAFREARPEGRVEARDPRDHRAPPAASRAPRGVWRAPARCRSLHRSPRRIRCVRRRECAFKPRNSAPNLSLGARPRPA
jgi:flagellar biosynthesis protein FlhF